MNFESLLQSIPYTLDELSTIPRATKRWKVFLKESAEEINLELYLSSISQPERGTTITISFYWAMKSNVVLVADKSSKHIVFVVPILFDSFDGFAHWLVWRLLVIYGHDAVESDFVKSQLDGLRIKILSPPRGNILERGDDCRCMEADRLDLL